MPGRNEQCPCGSGKKFKKCCLNKSLVKQKPPEVTGDSIIDKMIESFKEVDPGWKEFLVKESDGDFDPEDFDWIWPDAVNDALSEDWVSWDDFLFPPTTEAIEKYRIRKNASIEKWNQGLC